MAQNKNTHLATFNVKKEDWNKFIIKCRLKDINASKKLRELIDKYNKGVLL